MMERDYYLEAIKSTCYMKVQALRGGGSMMLPIFNLSTRRSRVVNTKILSLYPTVKGSSTHFTEKWVAPTGSLEGNREEKISCPHQGSKLDHPAHSKSP